MAEQAVRKVLKAEPQLHELEVLIKKSSKVYKFIVLDLYKT